MESMAETAPLIERSTLVKDLVRCLRDDTRSGAIVVGGAGTARPPSSRPPSANSGAASHLIRLTATPALAAVPFGALAPYLSRLPDRELDSYAAVVGAMADSLKSEADRPLFVVDDAHCLDHGTVGQLAQAAATGAAGILATCRPGPMIPEEFLVAVGRRNYCQVRSCPAQPDRNTPAVRAGPAGRRLTVGQRRVS